MINFIARWYITREWYKNFRQNGQIKNKVYPEEKLSQAQSRKSDDAIFTFWKKNSSFLVPFSLIFFHKNRFRWRWRESEQSWFALTWAVSYEICFLVRVFCFLLKANIRMSIHTLSSYRLYSNWKKKKLLSRVVLFFFFFFHAKSGTTNNDQSVMSDISF